MPALREVVKVLKDHFGRLDPEWDDQVPLFVAMKTKPVLFTRAELEGHIEADYTPQERATAH